MPEVTKELVCKRLKAVRADLSLVRLELRDITSELQAVRGQMPATSHDLANIHSALGDHGGRLDRAQRRLERVGT